MKIKEMSLEEVTFELNRAKFWVEKNPISKSMKIIKKMEKRKTELYEKKGN